MFNKSSLFLILLIVPIALSSDLFAKLENTDEGKTILNTLLIQTKLQGITADSIKTVLNNSQNNNEASLNKFKEQSEKEQAACDSDKKSLRDSLNESISKRYAIEKTEESTNMLKARKVAYSQELDVELNGYETYKNEVAESQKAWFSYFESMMNSINAANENLAKIRQLVNVNNPHLATSFAQTSNKSRESMINEIKSNLEYRYYDTLGMKPILTGLLEVASKGVDSAQFYKIMKTMDLIDNFLANRKNNLIEDNEYQSQYATNLTNSLNDSATSTKGEKDIVSGIISSLDTRLGLLRTSLNNAQTLVQYAQKVYEARKNICSNFNDTYFTHVRRYNSVRLTIAELSNAFDDEYKSFQAFLQKKMYERN